MPDRSTPSSTPIARLWVSTTPATVASITTLDERGWVRRFASEDQENVPHRDHDHDRDERRHRDDGHEPTESHDHHQQEHARREGREPPAPARLHVDHRLPDHGAARHPADESRRRIGDALGDAFLALGPSGVSDPASSNEICARHQAIFEQPPRRQGRGYGQGLYPQRLSSVSGFGIQNIGSVGRAIPPCRFHGGAAVEAERPGDEGEN